MITKLLSLSFINAPVVWMWHKYHIAQLNKARDNRRHQTFKAIKQNKLDIMSDFPKHDAKALESVVQKVLKDDVVVAEIGSWKGMSTAIIAKTVQPFRGKVFAVDHWQGSEGVPEHKQAQTNDVLSTFRYNMKALGVYETVQPMLMDSATASKIFMDECLDMVFIDADHRYSHIREDIELWLPKLKVGGIIAGHDAEMKYTHFSDYVTIIDKHIEEDAIVGICHPGVVKALYDVFHDDYNIVANSRIWWKVKGGQK